MKQKFKVTYMYRGTYSSHYSVVVKDWDKGSSKLTVKNKTKDLVSEFYNQVECTIKNTGNDLRIKIEFNEFILDYCEAEALLTALMVEDMREGKSQMIVEKKVGCTCK